MEKYTPKVGEECLFYKNPEYSYIVDFEDGDKLVCICHTTDGANKPIGVYRHYSGLSISLSEGCVKPLPTEELIALADKIYEIVGNEYKGGHLDSTEERCKQMAKEVIEFGYRKVEPLSIRRFSEFNNNDKCDIYNWLTKNNHIITK